MNRFSTGYVLGIAMGIIIGLLLAISIIDDEPMFKLPFTDKVFIRYPSDMGEATK